MTRQASKAGNGLVGKVVLGATGVALAAGAVAAASALANRPTRQALGKRASNAVKRVGKMVEAGANGYKAVYHRVGLGKGKKSEDSMMPKSAHAGKKSKRGRKG